MVKSPISLVEAPLMEHMPDPPSKKWLSPLEGWLTVKTVVFFVPKIGFKPLRHIIQQLQFDRLTRFFFRVSSDLKLMYDSGFPMIGGSFALIMIFDD